MPYGWEGNRRADIALAMHHRHQWVLHLRAQGLGEGDEHPPMLSQWSMVNVAFFAKWVCLVFL